MTRAQLKAKHPEAYAAGFEAAVEEVQTIIQHAREEGEQDMRQVRNWVDTIGPDQPWVSED